MEQDYLIEDGQVERLHAALVEALRRTRPDPFGTPVTVAEIYQDLVPYRSVRTALGFQMNADYEYTILRMLAGEAGLTRLEPAEAKQELRAELDAPNPNVGLFRKFAACDVWLEPSTIAGGQESGARVDPVVDPAGAPASEPDRWAGEVIAAAPEPAVSPGQSASAPEMVEPAPALSEVQGPADLPDEPFAVEDLSTVDWEAEGVVWVGPAADGEGEEPMGELLLEETVLDAAPPPDTAMDAATVREEETREPETKVMFDPNQTQGPVATATAGSSCAFCQSEHPAGREVRYCPYCGADQSLIPCQTCREALDPTWKFCIACGNQQG